MNQQDNESVYDNRYRVSKDVKKLKELGVNSPKLNWSKALKIGNCTFFPRSEKRRKAILEKYGIKKALKNEIFGRSFEVN